VYADLKLCNLLNPYKCILSYAKIIAAVYFFQHIYDLYYRNKILIHIVIMRILYKNYEIVLLMTHNVAFKIFCLRQCNLPQNEIYFYSNLLMKCKAFLLLNYVFINARSRKGQIQSINYIKICN
jgi:hypothetical protein